MGWTRGKARSTPEKKVETRITRFIRAAIRCAVIHGWPKARLLDVAEKVWTRWEEGQHDPRA